MASAPLLDRGVLRLTGEDVRRFLNGLVTSEMEEVGEDRPRFAALLTPQGKILCDFIVAAADGEQGGGLYLDCPRVLAEDLARRLGLYKLRAKVTIEDLSSTLAVAAWWDGERAPDGLGVFYPDPRHPALGDRVILDRAAAEALAGDASDYHAHRIGLGVPEGGRDFAYGDAFPHEADMDQFAGVDFDKGCYVGQEVVSRMQHRGTARTRVIPVTFADGVAPEAGTEATADGRAVGRIGSSAPGGRALALLRLDRVEDALAAGQALEAGGLAFRPGQADALRFPIPGDAAKPVA
ncbi:MAG: folate-binding protein [Alsobacter sp.]